MHHLCYRFLVSAIFLTANAEVDVITVPKPGEEYVFVQTSSSGARPIFRKDKLKDTDRSFETAHKIPQTLKFAPNDDDQYVFEKVNTKQKRWANPADAPAPAPAGAIKLDPLKLIERYKTELKASSSTTAAPKTSTTKAPARANIRTRGKPTKRSKRALVTESTPILTTAKAEPRNVDIDDISLVASGSEKQRSRIQIKKGPNGQEYEYEYVYYYYDDDNDKKDKVTNAHDGPARNEVANKKADVGPEPTTNEVLPNSGRAGRNRGRQLDTEDPVQEERLPANTRFPPRSRNLNTTPLPDEESKTTLKSKVRGRTESEVTTEADSFSEESQVMKIYKFSRLIRKLFLHTLTRNGETTVTLSSPLTTLTLYTYGITTNIKKQ